MLNQNQAEARHIDLIALSSVISTGGERLSQIHRILNEYSRIAALLDRYVTDDAETCRLM